MMTMTTTTEMTMTTEMTKTSDEPARMTMLRTPVVESSDDTAHDDAVRDDDELDSAARLRRVVHEAVAAVRAAQVAKAARERSGRA